jgi:hypothetical protein
MWYNTWTSIGGVCRGHDRMVVGCTTTYTISGIHHWSCDFESHSRLDTTLCDKVCKVTYDRSVVWSGLYCFTNKTDHHDNWNIVKSGVKHNDPDPL